MKKYFYIFLFLFPPYLYSVDLGPPKPEYSETLVKYFSEQKLAFLPLSPKIQYELLYDQRLVFLPARSTPGYNKKSDFVGVYLGNGLFIDADYNLSILLDRYFQSNVTSKPSFKFSITKTPRPSKVQNIEYVQDEKSLTEFVDKKSESEFTFEDNKIHLKQFHSSITPGDNQINYRVRSRSLEWVDGKISRSKEGVDINLDYPPGKIIIGDSKVSFEIPSDFFRSEIYEFRPYKSLELFHNGDTILLKTHSGSETIETSIFQSKNGLFIITQKGKSYRIFKDDKNKIHVILLSPNKKTPDQEIMTVEGL